MNTTNIQITKTEGAPPYRQTAINALAVIGFVALIALGVWGAVYSSQYVPATVGRIGSAAVYLGSLFNPAQTPNLSVVGTASTTVISFGNASSTSSTASTSSGQASSPQSATTTKNPVATTPRAISAGNKTNTTVTVSGGTAPATAYGLPDLAVTVDVIGYLSTSATDSFVASSSVPAGARPAVKFTIKNIGTNWTGTWRFTTAIPTRTAFTYISDPQQSLAPGDSIDYTLGFDRASTGASQPVEITVNSDNAVSESNKNNNTVSVNLTVLGS